MVERNLEMFKGLREELGRDLTYLEYFITTSGVDYMFFQCAECGEICSVEFLGHSEDASMNEMRFKCKKCGKDKKYKCGELIDVSREDSY